MLEAKIEALLFSAAKPLSIKKLSDFLDVKADEVEKVLENLKNRLNIESSGIRMVRSGNEIQIMTSPDASKVVQDFLEDEVTGELTRPQLETLTVIAYRQPITKAELEQIRGVNCSIIIRNLSMRGLIETEESKEKFGLVYRVTHDFLKFLGLSGIEELPDFAVLSHDTHIETVLEKAKEEEVKSETPTQV